MPGYKKILRIAALTSVALAAVSLTACMPSNGSSASGGSEATTAENYTYKGRKDPLMAQSASERADVMAKRFNLVQGRM